MKLYYTIFTLFSIITLVFSHNISNEINKRSDSIDWDLYEQCLEDVKNTFTEKCKKVIEQVSKAYEQCEMAIEDSCNLGAVTGITELDKLDSFCLYFDTNETCQRIFENGISEIPECKKLNKESIKEKDESLKIFHTYVNFFCTQNENYENCPLVEYAITAKSDDISAFSNAVNESCLSKKCTESAIENYSIMRKFYAEEKNENESLSKREFKFDDNWNDIESIDKMLEYLESEECKIQNVQNIQNSQSGAINNKYNTLLLTVTTLLLIIFI